MHVAESGTFDEISNGIILFNEYVRPYYLSPAASCFFWKEGTNDDLYEELVQTLQLLSESKLQLAYSVKLQSEHSDIAVKCSVAKFGRGYRVVMEDVSK